MPFVQATPTISFKVNLKGQIRPRVACSLDICPFLHTVLIPGSIGVTLPVPVSRRLSG